MRRFRSRQFVLLAVVALCTWNCGTTTTTPSGTTPGSSPSAITEVFSSQLMPNGAVTFTFTTNQSGLILVTLTTITPDSSLSLGLALGVLSGTSCELKITNDTALQGTVITGSAGTASSFCARVSDSAGVVTGPEIVSVTVTHF